MSLSRKTHMQPPLGAARAPGRAGLKGRARAALLGTLALAALAQTGCLPLVATGAAVGALATIDRRSYGAQTDDQGIELKAFARLRETLPNAGSVSVTSYNRRVLLTGQVANVSDKQNAEAIVTQVGNVKAVYNELAVAGATGVRTAASDTVITTKVKAALLDTSNLSGNNVKVVTENGVVYLMGIVVSREQTLAAQVASRVDGVQRVVTVFEVVSEEELGRIQATAGQRKE